MTDLLKCSQSHCTFCVGDLKNILKTYGKLKGSYLCMQWIMCEKGAIGARGVKTCTKALCVCVCVGMMWYRAKLKQHIHNLTVLHVSMININKQINVRIIHFGSQFEKVTVHDGNSGKREAELLKTSVRLLTFNPHNKNNFHIQGHFTFKL